MQNSLTNSHSLHILISDAHTVDMQERYLLCGSSHAKHSEGIPWVCKKDSQYVGMCMHRSNVTCMCDRWICFNCNDLNSEDITDLLSYNCSECTSRGD